MSVKKSKKVFFVLQLYIVHIDVSNFELGGGGGKSEL